MTVSEEMATELANKKAEREALRGVIQQWNANRLDLFELSEPNEDLEFHGVMRFYFQDSGQKVATKCIRVASDATSQAVIETLIEKFRPDMRMLSVPEYALYEIHENGEERKLGLEEKPLLVQLNWHIDDREGRFLLRRIDDKTNSQGVGFSCTDGSSFRRKLSKREKKQMKKQEKLSRLKNVEQDENAAPVDQNGVAEKLYTELPETSFTRSISNPEAVMRRRRQQKLERKLQQFRSKDGGPDTGGTLKIYGEALCKDVPYKTLLLSVRDSAVQVVREMLSKYGLEKVDPQQYCLVQVNSENNVNGGAQQEYILDDDECPLAILMNHPSTRGSIMFHVRRRPADYVPRKRKKKPSGKWNEFDHRYEDERLPFLLELNPDGSDVPNGAGARHRLQPNVTEVGSERPIGPQAVQAQTLTLTGPTVMPRHCVIAFTENIVTLTPCSRDAHTYVNNQRIHQTTILQNGAVVKFGRLHTFRFIDPAPEERIRQRLDSARQIEYGYDREYVERGFQWGAEEKSWKNSRRSPDLNSQEANVERYGSASGTPSSGQNQIQGHSQSTQDQASSHPSSPSKSTSISGAATTAACHARGSTNAAEATHNYETTFDLDGNVETASLTSSRDGSRTLQNDRQPRGTDPILPAVLEFLEETEETFFHAVITDVEPSAPQFKLAPTYTLYLAARYRASTHYRPELQPTERAHRLTVVLANVACMIQRVIQERYMDASSLALWLANGSELLHMLKNDRHVGAFSTRAQDILTEAVHTAFASLVRCISLELAPAMSQFMADADEPAKEAGVLQIFSNTMTLLRRCRVNAALTIQLFSHLFHAINATAFNSLVSNTNLCVRWFGRRLKTRLNALETWAERQGLELASQCHLATIMQATHLLQAPKYNAEELATLSSTCFKLNSLQVRALLQKYQPAADEPRLPAELIENVVRVAESVADTLARADGREIRLEEEPTLALALLLPEDGYSCEVIRGVPPGLAEFLAPLQRDGLCRMAPQPTSSGYWTIYMIDHHSNFRSPSAMSNRSGGGFSCHAAGNAAQPEIHVIKLHKSTNGMGLSIVAAKGAGQDRLGIYIKSVVAGGAADADGRLTAGDQLLKVDGQSLVGITQEKAAEYLVRTGPVVTLEVAKQGAIYHGLATLLSQPSPVMTRAHKVRPKSEHFETATVQETTGQPATSHSTGNLLRVPRRTFDSERLLDPVPGHRDTLSWHLSSSNASRPNFMPDRNQSRSAMGALLYERIDSIATEQPTLGMRTDVRVAALYNDDDCDTGANVDDSVDDVGARDDGEPSPSSLNRDGQFSQISQISQDCAERPNHGQPEDLILDANARLSTAAHAKHRSFSLDSIPYIDQTDDTHFSLSNDFEEYRSERSIVHDALQSCVDTPKASCESRSSDARKENLTNERVTDETPGKYGKIEIPLPLPLSSSSSSSPSSSSSTSPSSSSSSIALPEEGNRKTVRKSGAGSDWPECSAATKTNAKVVVPDLVIDSSSTDTDVWSDFASSDKCWKSPEDVRLGCSGRVAALAKYFSKTADIEFIDRRSSAACLLESSKKYASEPSFATGEEERRHRRPRSELDFQNGKLCWSKVTNERNDWHDVPSIGTKRKKEGRIKDTERLSLSEQRYMIAQLDEMSKLDDTNLPPLSHLSSARVPTERRRPPERLESSSVLKEFSSSYSCLEKIGNLSLVGCGGNGQACLQTRSASDELLLPTAKLNERGGRARPSNVDALVLEQIGLDARSYLRPRRMSERDLPSRLGRDATAPQQQIHTSKSVPALHNVGTDGKQQHEVFNPGYSRASSSNSVTPPVAQPSPITAINGTTSLRSRSSHNLHDPTRTLPPTGLVSRQQSSPNLNHGQTTASNNGSTTNVGTGSTILQSNEAERFYQNLSIYRNQDAATKQRHSPSQHSDDRNPLQTQKISRGSQNSLNRPLPGTFEANQVRDRPISAYMSQGQQQSYIPGQPQQQSCVPPPRSQSSRDIIRQEAKLQEMQEEVRRRELRGGVPIPSNQYRTTAYNAKGNMTVQSASGTAIRPTKSIGSQPTLGSSPPVTMSVSSIAPSTGIAASRQVVASSYGYLDAQQAAYTAHYGKSPHVHQHQHQHQPQHQHQHQVQHPHQHQHQLQHQLQLQHQHPHQHPHHQHHQHQQQTVGHTPYSAAPPTRAKHELVRLQTNGTLLDYGRDQANQDLGKPYADQNPHAAIGSQYYLNANLDMRNDHYSGENGTTRMQAVPDTSSSISSEIPMRPSLPEDGYAESPPPPPPPNASTHPLYSKQLDSRYTASMQDPPRGGYYPANTTGTVAQPRQYQFSASNPWQREEREKEQARRREAARQWRDQQIAELSSLPHRTPQQEEQLRALQLERDFQKRAEEVANQQDEDEESGELDAESVQRTHSLLHTSASLQDRTNSSEQNLNLSRNSTVNQSLRGNLRDAVHPLGGSPVYSANAVASPHGNGTVQQSSQNVATSCLQPQQQLLLLQQQENSSPHLPPEFQNEQPNQMQNNVGMIQMSGNSQKKPLGLSQSVEDKEIFRRHEEVKRKQVEFDDAHSKKKEEEGNKQQQMLHMYQQQQQQSQQSQPHHKPQQMLHPSMLRLDNLVINGSVASHLQSGKNDAPLPPERGSSYAIMSQQNALRSSNSNTPSAMSLAAQQQLTSVKRVSFHDTSASIESMQQQSLSAANLAASQAAAMDMITEDPNNFINDAEILLASPKTPEGPIGISITGSTPGVIGAQEVYKDPRQRRLAEKQKQQQNSQVGHVPEKLSFKEKMKMFAMETGEDGTPRDKVKISRAQREIDNIGNPGTVVLSNSNNTAGLAGGFGNNNNNNSSSNAVNNIINSNNNNNSSSNNNNNNNENNGSNMSSIGNRQQ